MLQLRCLMLLLSTAFQRGCVLLLCFVCGSNSIAIWRVSRHFSASKRRAKSILFKDWLSEIQNILSLEVERFGRERTVN